MSNKYLVYCCVFYNKDYFRLLNLLLVSMQYFSKKDEFDFLIITGPNFKETVENIGKTFSMNIRIQTFDFTTIFQAACARLFIFEYPEISQYEKILYLDTDIILKADITPIFKLEIEDLLYGIESGTLNSASFGSQFFDHSKIDGSKPGINSGTLLFKNSRAMIDLFSRIRGHIDAFTDSGVAIPYCMDQPFINYHAIKNKLYDNTLLNAHVSLFEGNDEVTNYETSSVCHFSYPIGNFGHKYNRMKKFLEKILSERGKTEPVPQLLGKVFSWGDNPNGYMKFKKTHVETAWGNGHYEMFDTHMVYAHWRNHYHLIKMNSDYTEYICVCTYPFDFVYHRGHIIENLPELMSLRLNMNDTYTKDNLTGIASKCDWYIYKDKLVHINETTEPRFIFINTNSGHISVPFFINEILPKINWNIVLILASTDYTFPTGSGDARENLYKDHQEIIKNLLNNIYVKKCFVENLDTLGEKLYPLPLGLLEYKPNYFTYLTEIEHPLKLKLDLRKYQVFCCHTLHHSMPQFKLRKDVLAQCNNEWKDFAYTRNLINASEFKHILLNSKFTLCVHGGGIDPAPRIWEALICGSIPIIEHSTLDQAYSRFPVVYIDNWDVNSITQEKLDKWLNELRPYYEDLDKRKKVIEMLYLDYWWNIIKDGLTI